jgi:hypothetical protein
MFILDLGIINLVSVNYVSGVNTAARQIREREELRQQVAPSRIELERQIERESNRLGILQGLFR